MPDHAIEAYNQFCGDHFHVYLKMKDEQIEAISFHGYGCAISKASTSVLVEQLSGKTLEEAKDLIQLYLKTIRNPDDSADAPEEFQAFAAAKKHPGREKCATLSWESMGEWVDNLG
ncbi:UNVERIFIED_CONTAM: hypothetical protein GTU68_041443 [Idotea baltica]|nr:hypothetical protein [Idotea baltica]